MDRQEQTFVTLFENKPGQLEGDTTIRATVKPDGSVDLVDSMLNRADDRVFGRGTAFRAKKVTPNQPDLKGRLQIPFDSTCEGDPGQWQVAGWWRWTRRGKRALRLCLTLPTTSSTSPNPSRTSSATTS